jgi:hypothetical protein
MVCFIIDGATFGISVVCLTVVDSYSYEHPSVPQRKYKDGFTFLKSEQYLFTVALAKFMDSFVWGSMNIVSTQTYNYLLLNGD